MAHQREVLERMIGVPGFALLWEMGTGKSKPVIDEIAALRRAGKVDLVIILSDKGCYENWPATQLPAHMPGDIKHRSYVWRSSSKKSEREILELTDNWEIYRTGMLPVVCANVEAFSQKAPARVLTVLLELARAYKSVYLCVDEATSIKTHNSNRTKQITKLGQQCAFRRILTGTPMTQDLFDLYAPMVFLDPAILKEPSFYTFRARYGVFEARYLGPYRTFQELVGFKNQDELLRKIAPYASRITKAECLDLPPKVYLTRSVEMSPDQKSAYKQMKQEGLAILANEQMATATTALEIVVRLRQICSGFVLHRTDPASDTEMIATKLEHNRLRELCRVIEESTGKAIIWCAFKHDVRAVTEALIAKYGLGSAVHYFGDTSEEDRQLALKRFNDPNDPCRFFVGTARTGGKSLTLTIASLVIYYSNTYSLEERLQSEDRAHRIGQTKSVTYVDLICPNTVDEEVLQILKGKQDMATMTLTQLTSIIKGRVEVAEEVATSTLEEPGY